MRIPAWSYALALGALLSVGAIAPISRAADTTTIAIKSFHFGPPEISIAAGTTVTWQNQDEEPHTITSTSGDFRSGAIDGGESFSFKFDKPGRYQYVCSIHPRMVGTVVVK